MVYSYRLIAFLSPQICSSSPKQGMPQVAPPSLVGSSVEGPQKHCEYVYAWDRGTREFQAWGACFESRVYQTGLRLTRILERLGVRGRRGGGELTRPLPQLRGIVRSVESPQKNLIEWVGSRRRIQTNMDRARAARIEASV